MNITLVGAGMGTRRTLTREALDALLAADAVIGSARLLAGLPEDVRAEKIPEALPGKIVELLADNTRWRSVCVVLSGDAGFHSGAKRLLELLRGTAAADAVAVLPGISSPQYFAARLRRPWQDFRLASAHGADCDILAEALNSPAVFFLTGGKMTPATIAETLCAAGLCDARVTVGENLSSPDERITAGTAAELRNAHFAPLSVALVENAKTFARETVSAGLPDSEFVRGNVPMTKREVRALALSLLELRPRDIVYDVGAGTGSMAVEAALLARRGRVYAFERDSEACGLLAANREKFGVYNMIPVPGSTPETLAPAPPPDAAFVGGSGGELPAILKTIVGKNPLCRIVVSAVTLETLSSAMESMRALSVRDVEVSQIAASRAVVRGGYHMLEARNPVFLVSGGGRGQ
jgi:precorrin-6Y C5,15-methyltransferase (decarboxylating)